MIKKIRFSKNFVTAFSPVIDMWAAQLIPTKLKFKNFFESNLFKNTFFIQRLKCLNSFEFC
jgi:hypothetical protein